MATTRWGQLTSNTVILSTELNSLTNGSNKITTSPLSNDAEDERYLNCILKMTIGSQTARTGAPSVDIYFIPEEDGDYAFGGDSLDPPAELLVWSFSFDASATARINVSRPIELPPTDFHVLLINNTSQTFNASGNLLEMEKFNLVSSA